MEIHAIVADVKEREHFIETYDTIQQYEKINKKRLKEESDLEFVETFSDEHKAVLEARKMSRPSYAKGWRYNESRNEHIKKEINSEKRNV